MKRAISLTVFLALTLSLLSAPAQCASNAYGSDVWLRDAALQDGVTYSENIFWSSGYDKPRHEYYFTYTPGIGGGLSSSGSDWNPGGTDISWLFPGQTTPQPEETLPMGVRPAASYGSSVCGRSTVSEAAAKYEAQGYRIVGAINGDFYDTATGYPLGILVSGGELLSGSSEYYAAGFRADGTAVMGYPQLSIMAYAGERSL